MIRAPDLQEIENKKILLVGGTGFVGAHLQAHLPSSFVMSLGGKPIDIRNLEQVKSSLLIVKPDFVIHLAAQSSVPESFKNPYETFDVNFTGTLNVLKGLEHSNFKGRFLYIGSGEVYGLLQNGQLPFTEEEPLKPRSPYAVSKVAAEALCYQWSQTSSFEVIAARPFNHIGPGQNENFAIPDFARQIIEIKLGKRPPIVYTGDIDVTRDFTDVRDVVKAYSLLLLKGKNGETYNVCSSKESSIRGIINTMMKITSIKAEIKQDEKRLRLSEHRRICGSFEKLNRDTTWKPEISIETTLNDVLEDLERKLQT